MERGIFLPDLAKLIIDHGRVGESYRPSNGFEGGLFEDSYCNDCKKLDPEHGCSIQSHAFFLDKDEEGYPKEWVYGPDGQPTCTAFEEE